MVCRCMVVAVFMATLGALFTSDTVYSAEPVIPSIPSQFQAQPQITGISVNASDIVQASVNHWRGLSSHHRLTMTIVRSDWQRTMSMQGWTQGQNESLIRVIAPKKDRGNGTLLKGRAMWSYSPKINRVIKVPSSMMGQNWMGSDFSNKDVARSDDILTQYEHVLVATESDGDHQIYIIDSTPRENAPVVWGRERLSIRDDHILLQHQFFDQSDELVKTLNTLTIREFDGRTVAQHQRMQKQNTESEWTEITVDSVTFDVEIPANMFTLSNLRNPRH